MHAYSIAQHVRMLSAEVLTIVEIKRKTWRRGWESQGDSAKTP
jgi:hypothetical protein